MISVMGSSAINEFHVVVSECESGVHLFVGERPIAMLVIEVATAVLEEYT